MAILRCPGGGSQIRGDKLSMKNRTKELFFAISISIISLLLIATSFTYPPESSDFPKFLCGLMVLFSFLILIKALRLSVGVKGSDTCSVIAGKLKTPAMIFSMTIAYIAGIMYIGYFVSSVVFFMGSMSVFGKEKFMSKAIAAAGFLVVVYALFVSFLGIRLPEGLLF